MSKKIYSYFAQYLFIKKYCDIYIHYVLTMFKKLANVVPALWVAVLPFLTQITFSGWNVALESTELTTIWSALTEWWTSLLNVWIQVMPYAIAMTIIMIIFGLVKNWSRLRNRFGGRRG